MLATGSGDFKASLNAAFRWARRSRPAWPAGASTPAGSERQVWRHPAFDHGRTRACLGAVSVVTASARILPGWISGSSRRLRAEVHVDRPPSNVGDACAPPL